MAFTHVVTASVNVGGTVISASNSYSADGRTSLIETIPGPSNNMLINFAIDVTQIQSLYVLGTGNGGTFIVKTNDSGAPDDTITLYDGVPVVWWTTNCQWSCPFTVDVTKLYVSTLALVSGILKMEILHDATP